MARVPVHTVDTMTAPRFLYCWFDTEYTKLDLDAARLLEVALIVTDDELVPIRPDPSAVPKELMKADGFSAVLTPPAEEEISEHVRENYAPLLARCRREGRDAEQIDALLAAYMDEFPECRHEDIRARPVLAGNSIYADYFLARKYLPEFLSRLSYRQFDVTTFKLEWLFHYRGAKFEKLGRPENIRKYYGGKDEVTGDKHDAYYDVQASMAELAFYRSQFRKV